MKKEKKYYARQLSLLGYELFIFNSRWDRDDWVESVRRRIPVKARDLDPADKAVLGDSDYVRTHTITGQTSASEQKVSPPELPCPPTPAPTPAPPTAASVVSSALGADSALRLKVQIDGPVLVRLVPVTAGAPTVEQARLRLLDQASGDGLEDLVDDLVSAVERELLPATRLYRLQAQSDADVWTDMDGVVRKGHR